VQSTLYRLGPKEIVASYATYAEAEQSLELLVDQKFSAERLAIVAGDLSCAAAPSVRSRSGSAALQGSLSGALTGAFVGFQLGVFNLASAPLPSAAELASWGLAIGAAVGAAIAAVAHGLGAGAPDVALTGSVQAGHYDVLAEPALAADARRALHANRTHR
jgi:hypothetical protein